VAALLGFSGRIGAVALRWRDPYSQVPYCTFGPRSGLAGQVRVFVTGKNTRALAFGPPFLATETEVTCRGATPAECLGHRAKDAAGVPNCEALQCACQPEDLATPPWAFMTRMLKEIQPRCEHAGNKSETGSQLLMVGLGGGALPRYVHSQCAAGTKLESVERDPRVIEAATRFFGLNVTTGVHEVEQADALDAVEDRARRGRRYDAVLVDCFGAEPLVPEHCRSEAFVGALREIVAPGGRAVQSVWRPQYDALLEEYQRAFGSDHVRGEDVDGTGADFLIVAEATS